MVSIARRNLFADIPRLLVAQVGITFAVSLVTIQTGIFLGFIRSTTMAIENSAAEYWLASEETVYWELTESALSTDRLQEVLEIEGVNRAEPLYVTSSRWNSERSSLSTARLIGVDPEGILFSPGPVISGDWASLDRPLTAIIDRANIDGLGVAEIGDVAELNGIYVELGGLVRDSQSISSSPFAYLSLANIYDYQGLPFIPADATAPSQQPVGPATYFLLDLADGADPERITAEVTDLFPGMTLFSKREMIRLTQTYWRDRTGIGFILGTGAIVGAIVGVTIVGQILYSSVVDRLRDFGTLRAMGADDSLLYSIILQQAGWMAVLGYLPGISLCLGLSAWAMRTQGVLILITPSMAIGVFGLTVGMCAVSALFAIQKATRVDPGIVFKA